MIRSMTGFAQSEKVSDGITAAVTIRTYNSKNLDLAVKIFGGPSELEEKIRAYISSRIVRGRIEIRISLTVTSEEVKNYEIDHSRARAYFDALSEIRGNLGIKAEVSLENVISGGGIIRFQEAFFPVEKYWEPVSFALETAVGELVEMRLREGQNLHDDIESRINFIEIAIDRIESGASGLPAIYRDRLLERIKNLTDGVIELDQARLVQEAAMLADRSDISEEIVRARSHVKLFREIMNSEEPGGRKMNFLIQEFGREFNTMGSKTTSTKISHLVVEMKSELEKLREQIQNVE